MISKIKRYVFQCSKCPRGIVEVIHKEHKDTTVMNIKMCNYCKHQYTFKELLKLNDLTTY